eukprot:gene24361-30690_t
MDELIEDEQFHELLKELRALPNPSDKAKDFKRGDSPSDDNFLNALRANLEGDDEDEDDLEKKNKKNKSSGNISTMQAIDMIRSLLSEKTAKSENKSITDREQTRSPVGFEADGDDDVADAKEYENVSTKNAFKGSAPMEVDATADEKVIASAELRRDPSKKEFDSETDTAPVASSSNKVAEPTKVLQRKPSAKLSLDLDDEESSTVATTTSNGVPLSTLDPTRYSNLNAVYDPPAAISGQSMVCKLKDHRIPAGCTAIVAFKLGNQLYVANAGDSRGVLCRQNGVAYALSEDHKPQSEIEMKRITSAGGFVNAVGRINGNLNLSRSLGDMKYKQLFRLTRAEQIITAEPDISVTTIEETDRFFILACDGIWDCLTNQQAVDFVRERLDQGMDVTKIVHEVCNHCVAADPRQSTGIGSDNMTCMIVLLHQE